ncbi:MAG: ATP-grasp domain-containing protein [Planctomycetaceae bacterium]|nr:ATP-grasp domain-containing protein [Planctomycetaceae bacterium]
MLRAIAEDFCRIPDCVVTVSWDARLGTFPVEGVRVVSPATPAEELELLTRESAAADAALMIAPEFHDLLTSRAEAVLRNGGRLLGSDPATLRLCGDKLALSRHLGQASEVAHLRTELLPPAPSADGCAALPFPVVIKPRFGAGSTNTFLIRDAVQLDQLFSEPFDPPDLPPDTWQSYVSGRPLSIAALVHGPGMFDLFPVGEQRLTDDGRFQYRGGIIPARNVDTAALEGLVRRVIGFLPGLRGYIGFDVLVPDRAPHHPVLVEINPRLTTSYLGYRRLAKENLAARWLSSNRPKAAIDWRSIPVQFTVE